MRKYLVIFFALCTVALSSCSSQDKVREAKETAYENYFKYVTENTKYDDESLYFTLNTEMSRLPDDTYRYYVIVDEPKTAMYDCVLMAVENDLTYSSAEKIMPSMGIFDADSYCLIPGQVNSEEGFVKGLVISGECTDPEIDLRIMVEWKNASRKETRRIFVQKHLKYTESSKS